MNDQLRQAFTEIAEEFGHQICPKRRYGVISIDAHMDADFPRALYFVIEGLAFPVTNVDAGVNLIMRKLEE